MVSQKIHLRRCVPCMVGARCACPISGAKNRAPTIEAIDLVTFYEIIRIRI
jgi:hypothetical protein